MDRPKSFISKTWKRPLPGDDEVLVKIYADLKFIGLALFECRAPPDALCDGAAPALEQDPRSGYRRSGEAVGATVYLRRAANTAIGRVLVSALMV